MSKAKKATKATKANEEADFRAHSEQIVKQMKTKVKVSYSGPFIDYDLTSVCLSSIHIF